ncbi:MAG: hypothetical protein IT236_00605 [Bacteroidia bacterium]|nr:hypothetical protein [Bacteroidia bacterium]
MYKQHLLQNIEREIILLKQLTPFIEEKDLAFKPAENVRSTYELMQYLSNIGSYMFRWMVKNNITDEVRAQVKEYRSTLTIANFNERLDKQLEEIKAYMAEITEEDLLQKEVLLPTRESMPLGAGIMNAPIKWLTAYRMELFVYLKMNGHSTLSTKEAWTVVPA